MNKDGILPFCEYFDELEMQPLLASRAKYRKAVEMALEWQVNQDRALENVYDMRLRQLHAQEAEKLRRKIGNLSEIPQATCGVCIFCQSKKHESQNSSFSERHIPRASTRQKNRSPLKGVRSGHGCPQLRVGICRLLHHSCVYLLRTACRYSQRQRKVQSAPNLPCCERKQWAGV